MIMGWHIVLQALGLLFLFRLLARSVCRYIIAISWGPILSKRTRVSVAILVTEVLVAFRQIKLPIILVRFALIEIDVVETGF